MIFTIGRPVDRSKWKKKFAFLPTRIKKITDGGWRYVWLNLYEEREGGGADLQRRLVGSNEIQNFFYDDSY